MTSKTPGKNSPLGCVGVRTLCLRAKNSCLRVRLIPGSESSAQCTWFSYSVREGGFSGSLISKTRYSDKLNGGAFLLSEGQGKLSPGGVEL